MKALTTALATSGMIIGMASAAFAADSKRALLDRASLSMTDAIAIAVERVAGRVYDAELDSKRGNPVFDITIVDSLGEYEIHVDGNTGAIMKVEFDK